MSADNTLVLTTHKRKGETKDPEPEPRRFETIYDFENHCWINLPAEKEKS